MQNKVNLISIKPPPPSQQQKRNADFPGKEERSTRYTLPSSLNSSSPVGYRMRLSISEEEARQMSHLFSLEAPSSFLPPEPISEQALFEESALGILSSRQSTNYQGFKQFTFGPKESEEIYKELKKSGIEGVLQNASHTHIIISKPYRTPFTFLLTFIGHQSFSSLWTVPIRAWKKKFQFIDDIPTIGYLQWLHLGILAESMERAAVISSGGSRAANVLLNPFCDSNAQEKNKAVIKFLEGKINLSKRDRAKGWRIRMLTQVGQVEQTGLPRELYRKVGANLMAFRSERIQPGVNQEAKAPPQYQNRQDMDVGDDFVIMAGRSAYNAFHRWTGLERDTCKSLLMNERVDVLTPGGKDRLRGIRSHLSDVTDKLIQYIPLWADIPMAKALSKNAERGRKAFALAGQRIYILGLDPDKAKEVSLPFNLGIMAVGAAAARSAFYCELSGCINIPDTSDMLTGVCLMAGPVNQNDIGKQFYNMTDLLAGAYPSSNPTSLLVWTLKAKTVADPIGNEEQLMNPKRKGALVELRRGPHDRVFIKMSENWQPMRKHEGQFNTERAFGEQGNYARSPNNTPIHENEGQKWPTHLSEQRLWLDELDAI
jgi:hypothetical protein